MVEPRRLSAAIRAMPQIQMSIALEQSHVEDASEDTRDAFQLQWSSGEAAPQAIRGTGVVESACSPTRRPTRVY